MQRKTRVLLRAAKMLELEAREYVQHGKETPEDEKWAGLRAQRMFGVAHSVKIIATAGHVPTNKAHKDAATLQHVFWRKK